MNDLEQEILKSALELLDRYKCLLHVSNALENSDKEFKEFVKESNELRLSELAIVQAGLSKMANENAFREGMYIVQMNDIANTYNDIDEERGHHKADKLLVEFVRQLGYEKLANSYERIDKWYA